MPPPKTNAANACADDGSADASRRVEAESRAAHVSRL